MSMAGMRRANNNKNDSSLKSRARVIPLLLFTHLFVFFCVYPCMRLALNPGKRVFTFISLFMLFILNGKKRNLKKIG